MCVDITPSSFLYDDPKVFVLERMPELSLSSLRSLSLWNSAILSWESLDMLRKGGKGWLAQCSANTCTCLTDQPAFHENTGTTTASCSPKMTGIPQKRLNGRTYSRRRKSDKQLERDKVNKRDKKTFTIIPFTFSETSYCKITPVPDYTIWGQCP